MERRQYTSMAVMAGLGILAAGVAVIALGGRGDPQPPPSSISAVLQAAELIRLRMDGQDSGPKRRALKHAAGQLPDSPMSRALVAFGDGNLEAAVKEPAQSPFAQGLRGWILIELGRRAEAAEELKRALGPETSPEWEFRPLFEAALKKAE